MTSSFDNRLGQVDTLNQFAHVGTVVLQPGSPRAAKRPMLAPSTPDNYSIVGRDERIIEIKTALLTGKPRAIAIELAMGIGKTALACLLANDQSLSAHFDGGILWANVGKAPDIRHELRRWAHELLHPDELLEEASNADHGTEAYWRRVVERALTDRCALLVIDDVWSTENGRAFKVGGNRCAYLFTTRFTPIANALAGKVITLAPLSAQYGIGLLEQFAPRAVAADPAMARVLVDRVDGLPQALIPIGCFLRNASSTGQARRIRDAMIKLDDVQTLFDLEQPPEYGESLPRSLRSVIEASYRWLGTSKGSPNGDVLRSIAESLAILRPNPSTFCEDLAGRVAQATPETLDALCDAGLIEARGDHFTMHRTFAEYLRGKLTLERRRELHLRATDFYREELNLLEDEYQKRESNYQQWYRYEDDIWGDTMDEWLYHLGRAGEYQTVIAAFVRAWFDGFWWWGCFLDFKFCDQLLREWQQRDIRPESREGLRLLTRFKDAYPKESADRQGGNWHEVEMILKELRSRMGLVASPGNAASMTSNAIVTATADARHLRGLTSIFLAEARRFGADDTDGAEVLYRDALEQFIANEDDWDTAWVYYHLADLLHADARGEEAAPLCLKALTLADKERDAELQANLWRVLGDVALARGDNEAAAQAYHQAVVHAYRFQIEPELPDPYTIRFYSQLTQLLAGRVATRSRPSPAAGLSLARALRAPWQVSARGQAEPPAEYCMTDASVLATQLFPAALTADLLPHQRERYATQVRAHLAALSAPDS